MKSERSLTSLIASVVFFISLFLFGFWLAGQMDIENSYAGTFSGDGIMQPPLDRQQPEQREIALFALG